MTSVMSPFEPARPQTHQGIHSSPASSPLIPRPASQSSLHLAPNNGHFSPTVEQSSPYSITQGVHQQPFRPYQPIGISPQGHFNNTSMAPSGPYQLGPAPLYDARGSQPMIRTISHAHPMHSATDATVSSRSSTSPFSITHDAIPTASYPSFTFTNNDGRHVNPAVFNSYPMSRSTSAASDIIEFANPRLLTPHMDNHFSPHESDLRKVSDSLGRLPSGRFWSAPSPIFDQLSPNIATPGLGPHPHPDLSAFGNRAWSNDFAASADRPKPEIVYQTDTDYERERAQQIMNNRKLLEDVGLGSNGQFIRSRNVTPAGDRSRKASTTPVKKCIVSDGPVRASPRIASQYRNVSYANLDGEPIEEESEEEYTSEQDHDFEEEEEDFRPAKRSRGGYRGGRKPSVMMKPNRRVELSLYGLLQVYPEIPHQYPLFYYTLNNDLTINSDSVPLIGSIPSTVIAIEKAEILRGFYHRSRRVLAQLDAFTARCDRKYDGPEDRLPELDQSTRVAIRDVRRKVVERCENYKYTRRDILDKHVGKNKWQPIEQGLIEWRVGMSQNDPAGDLSHVTLTLPTPPVGQYPQHRAPSSMPARQIRGLPSRQVSAAPASARTFSITMGEPDNFPSSAPIATYAYEAAAPMYGEDQVAMTVNMPMDSASTDHHSPLTVLQQTSALTSTFVPGGWDSKGVKRSRDDEEVSDNEDLHHRTLWQD